jgi:hypothetical protein
MFMKATPTPVQDWLWYQRLGDLKTMLEVWGISDSSIDTREKAVSALFIEITGADDEGASAASAGEADPAVAEVRRGTPSCIDYMIGLRFPEFDSRRLSWLGAQAGSRTLVCVPPEL